MVNDKHRQLINFWSVLRSPSLFEEFVRAVAACFSLSARKASRSVLAFAPESAATMAAAEVFAPVASIALVANATSLARVSLFFLPRRPSDARAFASSPSSSSSSPSKHLAQ